LTITRREFLHSVSALALVGALGLAAHQEPAYAAPANPPQAKDVPMEELLRPGPLPEQALGSPDAPVTIVEYASMTCGHCATFHEKTYPELKKRYIDTGKVRFIFREFPLDVVAIAAFMLARCASEGKYFPMVEVLFHQQKEWAVQRPIPPLLAIARQAGFSQQSFEQCLANQKLRDDIEKVRERAAKEFGVGSTPTFFVNGKVQRGAVTIEDLEKLIEPYLKS
jgi:protein-disulfide isomerase